MENNNNLFDLDPYQILGVSTTVSEEEIREAYCKKILSYNSKNESSTDHYAVESLQQLQKAFDVLINASTRAQYNEVINAKLESVLICKTLNKRRKFDNYDETERPLKRFKTEEENSSDEEKFEIEIKEFDKENSERLEKKNEPFTFRSLSSLQRLKDSNGNYHHWKKVYSTFYTIL